MRFMDRRKDKRYTKKHRYAYMTLLLVVLLVMSLLFMVACGEMEESGDDGSSGGNGSLESEKVALYSNLLDEESREKVGAVMEAAGISLENIELLFEQVDLFNDTIENYGLVEEGFEYEVSVEADYDPYIMQDIYYENSPIFMGYNCRITSYELMRGLMEIGKPVIGDTNIIIFDENSIGNGPKEIFTDLELTEFKSLYSAVPTERTKEIAIHVENVKKDWKEKQISFKAGVDEGLASLISVFFHEEGDELGDYLFIGHVGVLVPTEGQGFYFIEKVAFQEPYQVILFYDKVKLNDYLLEKYDLSWGQNTADPFVMENDELMVK